MENKNTLDIIQHYFEQRAGITIYVSCKDEKDVENEIKEIIKVMGKPDDVSEDDLTTFLQYGKMKFALTINLWGKREWKN